ncbi:MTR3 [Candida margitis]|uniref:MTR3 n=1 Tax=Candida margitis TaxID=1775924 RepID=UPI0022260F62|nr:MTR3 [Candida margitis]KAI5967739.1 MTR3 [Candida margitis]
MSDRRRITGPVNTSTPNIPAALNLPSSTTSNNNTSGTSSTSSTSGATTSSNQVPPFFLKHGLITNSNGSAYLEIDNTTIIQVSVFGPRPIRGSFIDKASVSVETKFLSHVSQPQSDIFNNNSSNSSSNNNRDTPQASSGYRTGMTPIEHRLSSYLESCILPSIILSKYPKSTIDLQVSVISTDPKCQGVSGMLWLMQWIVVASSLAIIDAGIEIRDVVSSGVVKLMANGDVRIGQDLDRHQQEEKLHDTDAGEDGVYALVSFMNLKNDEIVGCWFERDGNGDDEKLQLSEIEMEKLIDECSKMSKLIRANLNSYLLKSFN